MPIETIFDATRKSTVNRDFILRFSLALCLGISGCAASGSTLDAQIKQPELSREALAKIAESKQNVALSLAPLAISDAVRLSILASPKVQAADYEVSVADNRILIQRSAYFPEIYYEVSPVSDDGMIASAAAGLRYTLYDFGLRAAKTSSALRARQGAGASLIRSIDEIALETLRSYIELASAEDSLANTKALLRALEDEKTKVAERVESGAANAAELQSVSIGIIRAEARQIEATAERETAKTRLASHTGISAKRVESLKKLEQQLSAGVSPLDVEKTPLMLASIAERLAAEEELKAAKANLFPSLGIRAGVSTRVTDNVGFTTGVLSVGPSLGGSISLGQGKKYTVKNAELLVSIAQSNIAAAQREVALRDKNLRLKLRSLQDSYTLRMQVVSRAEELTRLRRVEYEAGSSNVTDIVDAIEEEYAARAAVIANGASILLNKVELLLNTGQLQSIFFYGNDRRLERTLIAQATPSKK